jgi:hypothetical protein
LNIGHGHVSALALKQSLAVISGKYQNLHDRVLVNTSEPLDRTNGQPSTSKLMTPSTSSGAVYLPPRYSLRGSEYVL